MIYHGNSMAICINQVESPDTLFRGKERTMKGPRRAIMVSPCFIFVVHKDIVS